jgi:hypothetical protein
MPLPNSKPGDLFLLFHSLSFDFSAELPLALGSGVCLEATPQQWLDSAENGLADYLLPGYSLPDIGINHCCLRCYVQSIPSTNLTSRNLLFLSVIALRLHDPIGIRIGGQFRLGEEDNRILDPTLYQLSSIGPINQHSYTPKSLEAVATIADRLLNVERQSFTKLQTALIFFGQVTIGMFTSFQLYHLGLFAALEALFVPSGNKALTLSRRVSSFLKDFHFPEPMENWIKDEYINGRHKLAHGIHNATLGASLDPFRHTALIRLHEITRLCLLGFLSLEDQKLKALSSGSGNIIQQAIENLGVAKGQYVEGQKMWLG